MQQMRRGFLKASNERPSALTFCGPTKKEIHADEAFNVYSDVFLLF
jgi:hypothetical protein